MTRLRLTPPWIGGAAALRGIVGSACLLCWAWPATAEAFEPEDVFTCTTDYEGPALRGCCAVYSASDW